MSRLRKSRRGNTIGRHVPDGMFTTTQFAVAVGVSPDTIRNWVADGHLAPADIQQHGKITVRLFSRDQIKGAKKLARSTGPLSRRVMRSA